MLLIVGYVLEASFRRAFLQMQRLRLEQYKTNIVLYNILPRQMANKLMMGEPHEQSFASVSVLFCDIYDFKTLTSSLSPNHVVALLNDVFSTFDLLTDRHEVLKVRESQTTIARIRINRSTATTFNMITIITHSVVLFFFCVVFRFSFSADRDNW